MISIPNTDIPFLMWWRCFFLNSAHKLELYMNFCIFILELHQSHSILAHKEKIIELCTLVGHLTYLFTHWHARNHIHKPKRKMARRKTYKIAKFNVMHSTMPLLDVPLLHIWEIAFKATDKVDYVHVWCQIRN